MGSLFRKRPIRYPLLMLSLLGLASIVICLMWNALIGILYGLILILVFILAWKAEMDTYKETEKHIEMLSYRLKKVGEEALLEMPIGIVLVGDEYEIEWCNPYMHEILNKESLIGEDLFSLSDDFYTLIKHEDSNELNLTLNERKYRAYYRSEEKLIYFFDITEQVEIEELYNEDRTVIAILFVDNYDEITQGMDDQTRSQTNSLVTSLVNNWSNANGIFLKRIAADRFIAILNESILQELEKKRFSILDDIREITAQQNLSLTLSIGVGASSTSLIELGELAQSSLDLVLGRGGDQVAIKEANGKVRFYGGKTNPVEKRTRVRARVISHALRDLIQGSDQIFVMGHKMPDMDAIGAAIGVRKMADMNGVKGYVVVDFDNIDNSINRLMQLVKEKSDLYNRFITPELAIDKMTEKSLLIIVDTHKPSMTIEAKLLNKTDKVVVIDHHRRGEEFVKSPMLVYMEPYASSTAELVTELLEYQPKDDKISMLEATALLAGIIVDTKSFTLRTGARTFEAASYLRTNGADTVLVQRLLKEDITTYIERSKIVQTAEFYHEGLAIARGDDDQIYNSVLIAQTADILLTMKDISASFVIAHRSDGRIGISARSLGEMNVQLVMEELGGGGHLTNAACQLEADTIDEAIERLKVAIDKVIEGGKES
ncbi:DHH family phosphoesterase [Rummeliibacillus sp. G93]|uniref:DHH family phosphoesterase n=1 Tax=Rummeliibacillus TaxID=648802 RepID=UPI00116FDF78|nr:MULTISPECIES: DHH family phosphoesterase [Rummeliibacillus]MBB5171147.1 c-di-AMP phosphodiesterase-like protein [Rummeliibacillus stabekisii]MCM3317552.1 DHH family phosphoesterase [Rummeliibacillus stabekisii]UQW97453.1 DHH family phosphoesterase [Rummeliibacillus sp. G93]GEL06148.1 cyclic-di-AMP phosphodiesterase GdpP [Rummeliibacillus stabekisii]